jgi:hypothetical protein
LAFHLATPRPSRISSRLLLENTRTKVFLSAVWALLVGPDQVVNIINNVAEKEGDFWPIITILGAKRAILGTLHRESEKNSLKVLTKAALNFFTDVKPWFKNIVI